MKLDLKNVAIVHNPNIAGAAKVAKEIALKTKSNFLFEVNNFCVSAPQYDAVVSVGGDGTLLKCADCVAKYDIKILGFNMGRLGYLAQANPDNIDEVIEQIECGNYRVEKRIMLEASPCGKSLVALNDIVIKGAAFSRTSTLDLYINDILVSKYLADGLIISTPTGSTAYTLSAGGPVLAPNLDAITICPICPHTLSARPLVIPSSEKIKVKLSDCNKFFVTADGQKSVEVECEIEVKKYEKTAKLVLLNAQHDKFYSILREKLHWGQKIDK